ncbi:hypothetical protein [Xylella fastidiosa]|uniref:Uncharacterized protein n=1 Tax=Xylella fastidiosa subsp. sandyi Ann-1 TaxID=155920 RepID=A0A060H2T3_XYLFS|nr:hypothetical protein [Xylella fastidiosa]AIC11074.1 hypothetical protein D934_04085 [Xylella fastidiosa subsp. sandyi Ann-1]UIX81851.1 hypothetical protein LZ756_02985 [Xylella fastidiosa subsp. sandyi]
MRLNLEVSGYSFPVNHRYQEYLPHAHHYLVNFSWLVVCHAADVAIRGDLVSLLDIV